MERDTSLWPLKGKAERIRKRRCPSLISFLVIFPSIYFLNIFPQYPSSISFINILPWYLFSISFQCILPWYLSSVFFLDILPHYLSSISFLDIHPGYLSFISVHCILPWYPSSISFLDIFPQYPSLIAFIDILLHSSTPNQSDQKNPVSLLPPHLASAIDGMVSSSGFDYSSINPVSGDQHISAPIRYPPDYPDQLQFHSIR